MPIKVYGKGDTVSDQEFWDGRTTYNGLSQFLEYNNNNIAIKNIFNDNTDVFSFVEAINTAQFYAGGVVRHSFQNELDIKQTDFHAVTINNRTRYYVRCSPGIVVNNSYAYINKPATELACAELREILKLSKDDDELVEIKYNYDNDTFKAKVHKIVNRHMEILEFTNGTNYEIDSEPGYNTGIELLAAMHDNEFLLQYFKDTVGDDLTKIDLEKTVEVHSPNTYYWVLTLNGELRLEEVVGTAFGIGNLTILDMNVGIDSFDNTHTYTGETEVVSGDLVVDGDLSIAGDLLGDVTITGNLTVVEDASFKTVRVSETTDTPAELGAGTLRWNSTSLRVEKSDGAEWSKLGGPTKGIFYENDLVVEEDFTLTAGKNAMSAGPITIANGVTVTIPDGASWSIV